MDVSVILVNWNSADLLRQCLASVFRLTSSVSLEVIVVDNASYDGADKMLQKNFPQVRFIQSSENFGFARANNLAFQSSTGRNVLFLNPDTVILGSAIAVMSATLDDCPEAGAVGCKILNA